MKIEIVKGDITKLKVDAVVNAANSTLLGGGGVDGAIHRVAGPLLKEECRALNGCETGNSKMTMAYNLPCERVIHTVGPIWKDSPMWKNKDYDGDVECGLLRSCYITSITLALENNLKSIAFPNISTGVYGFPKERAAKIAIETVKQYKNLNIVFCIFDDENYDIYYSLLYNTKAKKVKLEVSKLIEATKNTTKNTFKNILNIIKL